MLLDYIALGLLVASLIAILVIVWRKFPVVAAIKTETLKRHQQDRIKKGLFEDRLKRKLRLDKLPPLFKSGDSDRPSVFQRVHTTLKDMEQRYRTRIKEIEPEEAGSSDKKKNALVAEAKKLIDTEQYKEAEAKYIEAISLDSKYAEAYEGLADLYIETKDHEHAEEILQYLIKMHASPEVPESGSHQSGEGTPVSLNKELADYHVELGEIYMATDRRTEALQNFQEASKLEPNNPRVLDQLIQAAISLKAKDTAKEYYTKLKEVNPENEKLKEFQTAIKQLK